HPEESWEHAPDTRLVSGRYEAGRGRHRIEAPIAGPAAGGEHREHPFELEDRAVDVRLAGEMAGVVDEVAGREVVGPVHDDVIGLEEALDVVQGQQIGVGDELDVGNAGLDRVTG